MACFAVLLRIDRSGAEVARGMIPPHDGGLARPGPMRSEVIVRA
jgi:hypothetical protein